MKIRHWILGFTLAACSALSFAAPKKVCVFVYEGVELLDFAGPAEAFSVARTKKGEALYDVFLASRDGKPVMSQGFVKVHPTYSLKNCPRPDLLVLPGGDINASMADGRTRTWVSSALSSGTQCLSVCNGASLLASLGKLEGKTIATHRGNFEIVRALDPTIRVSADAKIVSYGQMTTAAGISSGIDGALYLISLQNGLEVAKRAANHMEYLYWPGLKADSLESFIHTEQGVTIQKGGERTPNRDYALMRLLDLIAEGKSHEDLLAAYRMMYPTSTGHDREMLEEPALREVSEWIFQKGRDKSVALRLAEMSAALHPCLADSHVQVGRILARLDRLDEAIACANTALQHEKGFKPALKLLSWCKSRQKAK